jgi:transcriptional regulator with XRE-family HTH domain
MNSDDPYTLAKKAATRAGVSLAKLCEAAGVHPTLPSRWKAKKTGANYKTLQKLEAAAKELQESNPYVEN